MERTRKCLEGDPRIRIMELIYILNGMLITQSLQLSNLTEIDIHLNFFLKRKTGF